jgi:ABC-type Zn uptake system ZnuABC Zn-binding protein ZnuA
VTLLAALFLLGPVIAAACGGGGGAAPEGRLRVVTTLEIFADFARQVGGDRVDAKALLPPGADPHTFELPPNRVADIARADIVFINGLGLEEAIEDVIRENASGPVVELPRMIIPAGGDPHLWLDPQIAERYVDTILTELRRRDPDQGDVYTAAARAYLRELSALDKEFEQAMYAIPREDRKLVTFHDAFNALADRYGLEVVGVVAPSPGQESNARDVAQLTTTLRSEGVPAVYKEPQFNARVLELAADDAGVRVLDLLSDAYTEGVDSYLDLMRFNMRQLQEGLGGD